MVRYSRMGKTAIVLMMVAITLVCSVVVAYADDSLAETQVAQEEAVDTSSRDDSEGAGSDLAQEEKSDSVEETIEDEVSSGVASTSAEGEKEVEEDLNEVADVSSESEGEGGLVSMAESYPEPTWSGASSLPVNATATYSVKDGSIKVKSGGSYVSVSGKKVTAKKAGVALLALLDGGGKERATKRVTVYELSGNYIIESAMNSSYALDIQKKSKENSAKMLIYTKNGGKNQLFQFVKQSDGTYGIKCVHSGKYVDVQGGGKKQGNNVIQYTWKGGANQRWRISVDASNRITFTSKNSGLVFDVRGGKAVKGKEIIQYKSNGGKNQKWYLRRGSGDGYILTGKIKLHVEYFQPRSQYMTVVSLILDKQISFTYSIKGQQYSGKAKDVGLTSSLRDDYSTWAQYEGRRVTVDCSSLRGIYHDGSYYNVDALALDYNALLNVE